MDRGLLALTLIAEADVAPSIDELAGWLGVHRSIAYRIVRTLEAHRLIERDAGGRCRPGVRLALLGRTVRAALREAAVGELGHLADDVGMTAFLVVADGAEAVTVESVEPSASQVHVAYRPGTRHPLHLGAPGLALLAGESPQPGERPEVAAARQRGWAFTSTEVLAGMASVAAPLVAGGRCEGAVAVVFLAAAAPDTEPLGVRVRQAAAAIVARLGG